MGNMLSPPIADGGCLSNRNGIRRPHNERLSIDIDDEIPVRVGASATVTVDEAKRQEGGAQNERNFESMRAHLCLRRDSEPNAYPGSRLEVVAQLPGGGEVVVIENVVPGAPDPEIPDVDA